MQISGCPYGRGRACWSSSGFIQSLESDYTCQEQSAEELRSNVRWSRLVESIRAIGEAKDTETEGKEEALLTAQAMWDHGCAFGEYLMEMDVTWGSCFSWRFDWGLKTVEVFCPTTCHCDSTNLDSGCPRPLGENCEIIADACVFASGSYICPENTPHFEGKLEVALDDLEAFDEFSELVIEALQRTLATLTGHGVLPEHVRIEESASRRLALARRLLRAKSYDYFVFVISEADATAARDALAAREPQAVFIQSLLDLGVPAEGAGLNIEVKGVVSSPPVTRVSTTISTTGTSLSDGNDAGASNPPTTTSTTSTSQTGSNETSVASPGDRPDRSSGPPGAPSDPP
ncbi:unnamed protein product [Symbiodinium necroappetens]|uniref:Uncharacterized protein n=1 Tax=Symbiodinium necroappetens TaxID=1628268 RepID=A0A812Z876_9DINO|nr:unnamed protein product [Symbiodinium necroappetens]